MGAMYDLTGEMIELQLMIEDAETDADRAALAARIAEVAMRMDVAADGCARLMRNLGVRIEAYKAEEQRLAKRRRALENGVERIKSAMLAAMDATGTKRVNTSIGVWSVRMNRASVCIDDRSLIPEAYLKQLPPEVDKQAIQEAYKLTGEEIPGTHMARSMSVTFY